ncbi:hypothetical protein A374_04749 [Fictibacillus macauensis ZFHKF-1]|uniref:Lipoprotein n=1 Tax=Fictibacillus macauensis ZFHKF-1 TaxID=1196324 RepID=I8AMF0_9BACL|nr:hypothetical protein [Fictibacillus macauensis]EIT86854.1 hypothetical protein A374_04749 [Fictibacillus macauensis ZFHKF-1]
MKKRMMGLAAVALLAFSVGCQDKDSKSSGDEKKGSEKDAVVSFTAELGTAMKKNQEPISNYIGAKNPELKTPKADLEKLKKEAKDGADQAAKEIPEMKIPGDVSKENSDKLKEALADLGKFFKTEGENLDAKDVQASGDASFKSFNSKVDEVNKKLGLATGDLHANLK